MSEKKNNVEKTEAAPVELIREDDFTELENAFRYVRGNQTVINDESLMANCINYKTDLFQRMRATLDKLAELDK